MNPIKPIISVICICALVYFYTLQVVGYEIPLEINSLWIPVLWWFRDETLQRKKEGK